MLPKYIEREYIYFTIFTISLYPLSLKNKIFNNFRLAAEWVRQPTILESDGSNVVAALRAPAKDRGRTSHIIKETKEAMHMLPVCEVNNVRRVQ